MYKYRQRVNPGARTSWGGTHEPLYPTLPPPPPPHSRFDPWGQAPAHCWKERGCVTHGCTDYSSSFCRQVVLAFTEARWLLVNPYLAGALNGSIISLNRAIDLEALSPFDQILSALQHSKPNLQNRSVHTTQVATELDGIRRATAPMDRQTSKRLKSSLSGHPSRHGGMPVIKRTSPFARTPKWNLSGVFTSFLHFLWQYLITLVPLEFQATNESPFIAFELIRVSQASMSIRIYGRKKHHIVAFGYICSGAGCKSRPSFLRTVNKHPPPPTQGRQRVFQG